MQGLCKFCETGFRERGKVRRLSLFLPGIPSIGAAPFSDASCKDAFIAGPIGVAPIRSSPLALAAVLIRSQAHAFIFLVVVHSQLLRGIHNGPWTRPGEIFSEIMPDRRD